MNKRGSSCSDFRIRMRQIAKSKRSAEMTIGTLVIIVLAIIVLVVVALGFGTGWSSLWGKVTGYFSTANVDSIRQACAYSCTAQESYNFCTLQREVVLQDKTKIKGKSCAQLESIGVEKCSDINCEGKLPAAQGTQSVQMSGLLLFEETGNFKTLSEEECIRGLEQRKKDLGVPDKFCYWKTMTRAYLEKCKNLNEKQISEIFEKKEDYRKLNNADWPSLTTEGDFCVSVVYSCGEWKKKEQKGFGFFNPNALTEKDISERGLNLKDYIKKTSVTGDKNGEIQINPYFNLTKKMFVNAIIHEGLHSIQSKNDKSKFGYVLTELDPRLSEVNRWWLDKTSPNCEVIYTTEKAKIVLDKYLAEKDIGEEYLAVQSNLKKTLEIAKETGREEEIYNKMISRIPGLAMDDSRGDGTELA